jgi:hypothetical protein
VKRRVALYFQPAYPGPSALRSFAGAGDDERVVILEALFACEAWGKRCAFDQASKLRNTIGLQVDGDTTSEHVNLLGCDVPRKKDSVRVRRGARKGQSLTILG